MAYKRKISNNNQSDPETNVDVKKVTSIIFELDTKYQFPTNSYPSDGKIVLNNQDVLFRIILFIPEYTVHLSVICKLFFQICKRVVDFYEKENGWNWVYGLSRKPLLEKLFLSRNTEQKEHSPELGCDNLLQLTENMIRVRKNFCWTIILNDSLMNILNSYRQALTDYYNNRDEMVGFKELNNLLDKILTEVKSKHPFVFRRLKKWRNHLCSDPISTNILDPPLYYKNIAIFVFSEIFFGSYSREFLEDGIFNWFLNPTRQNHYKHSIEQLKFSFFQIGLLNNYKSGKSFWTKSILILLSLAEFK